MTRESKPRKKAEKLEVEDSSILTDADWEILNEMVRRHGLKTKALRRAFEKLAIKNPPMYARLLAAFDPRKTREALLDAAAELGLDDDDIRELIRHGESPSKRSH